MTNVTIDLADLERLVMTTGALKVIEQAMQQRRNDPFVREHLNFTEAHDRLATAMRNAQRSKNGGNTVVDFDGPLEDDEAKTLCLVASSQNWFYEISNKEKLGTYFKYGKLSVFDRLAAKGMCIIGQLCEGAVFAGEPGPQIRPVTRGFAVKVTDRGRAKAAEIDAVLK